jgi:Bacterial Ig-like domain (group 3)
VKPGIWAGGGGASAFFSKPAWQAGVAGIPSDSARDVPDVSLTAAAHDPYLICLRGSCVPDSTGKFFFAGVSATSASTPAFAGVMAMLVGKNGVRLGQPNYVLYRLAAAENLSQCNASSTVAVVASTCVFNDVTSGNNAVPGEPSYGAPAAKYASGTGYDLATGLGSMNVTNLLNQWNSVTFTPTSTAFTISPTTAQHGDALNVTVNVTPNSGSGIPTGVVWLQQNLFPHSNLIGDNTADILLLTAGTFAGVTHALPGGTYQVNAHYAGDGTYGGSASAPPVTVTISPEPTTMTFSVLTTDSGGNLVPFSGGVYGTPIYYQAQLSWKSGYGLPSGWVTFLDNGGFPTQGTIDKHGTALTPVMTMIPVGAHAITEHRKCRRVCRRVDHVLFERHVAGNRGSSYWVEQRWRRGAIGEHVCGVEPRGGAVQFHRELYGRYELSGVEFGAGVDESEVGLFVGEPGNSYGDGAGGAVGAVCE